MKYNIFKGLLLCGSIVVLAGCDENAWNDEYLDGFEEPPVTSGVANIEYTLTAADYKTLAGLDANKALAEADGLSKELEAVGTNGYFTDKITAQKYLPAFLGSSSFPYFAENNGSTVKTTYNYSVGRPALCKAIYDAKIYTVTNDDYISAWGSDAAYTDAFSPSTIASNYIPGFLATAYPDAEEGSYVIANYNQADTDPEFKPVVLTDIKDVTISGNYTVKGYITGICAQGYILTDATGSLLVYYGKSFVPADYKIGMEMQVSGSGSKYNGGLQISPVEENNLSSKVYSYPTPETLTAASFDTYAETFATANAQAAGLHAAYVTVTGTFYSVGTYINFSVEGATYNGSFYQAPDELKALCKKDETVTVTGYVMSANINSSTKKPTYLNFIVTEINGKAWAPMAEDKPYVPAPTPIDKYADNGLYYFNGTKWAASDAAYMMSPADNATVGYGPYLSNDNALRVLPIFLKQKFPYATEGQSEYVAYQTTVKYANCRNFVYNGTEWVLNEGVEVMTDQFAKVKGNWMFDPNVVISIPAVKNSEIGTQFYKPIVDWVRENKGAGYIDSYGNSEFYSGASYYYSNINLSVATASGYSPWADTPADQIQQAMKDNFLYETMPLSLKANYPDANLIDGYTEPIIYEIDYITYDNGAKVQNANDTVKYEVVGPAEWKLVYSTWLGGKVE
ncbi:MAG: hypothetical protein NC127_05525 [Muribaculum sp.]|nr:hypothetical protein [Muribaculum sp.]